MIRRRDCETSRMLVDTSTPPPTVQELNLSYVSNLTDSALHKLLSAPRDSRPGLLDKKSRLKLLRKLSVRNTEVGPTVRNIFMCS